MVKWLFKTVAAILIWVAVALLVAFLGKMAATVAQPQIHELGKFLVDSAGVIGFLVGAWYFIWGPVPPQVN